MTREALPRPQGAELTTMQREMLRHLHSGGAVRQSVRGTRWYQSDGAFVSAASGATVKALVRRGLAQSLLTSRGRELVVTKEGVAALMEAR